MNISNTGAITANACISVVYSTADIRGEARSESHATPVGLYVTANLGTSSAGVEFRHSNGTQGVGFGYNSIYAMGSNTNQDLNFYPRGSGVIYAQSAISCSLTLTLPTTSSGSLTIRQRPSSTNDPQIFFKSGRYTNYGIIVSLTALLHVWTTSNSTGEPSGSYHYVPLNGAGQTHQTGG